MSVKTFLKTKNFIGFMMIKKLYEKGQPEKTASLTKIVKNKMVQITAGKSLLWVQSNHDGVQVFLSEKLLILFVEIKIKKLFIAKI